VPDLILLTRSYPHLHTEPFLEPELEALAKVFDSISIVPLAGTDRRRPVPDNVLVYDGVLSSGRWPTVAPLFRVGVLREIAKRGLLRTPSAIWSLLAFCQHRDTVDGWLTRTPIKSQATLLYSYWLRGTAAGAARHRHRFAGAVSRGHGIDVYHQRHPGGYMPYHESTIAGLDQVYCVSDHGRNELATRYPKLQANLSVARLGVRDHGMARGSSSESVSILTCARLSSEKRPLLMADSIVRFAASHSHKVIWNHFGGGPMEGEVRTRVRDAAMSNLKVTMHGQVAHAEIMQFCKTQPIDVFLLTSLFEGAPVSVMEALSFGIPVVSTRAGGTAELVGQRGGQMVELDASAEAISEAMSLVVRQLHFRQGARKQFDDVCRADHNFSAFAESLLTITQLKEGCRG
jgi:glycosyltransferase involved in cell wall biosynthesis